MDADTIQEMLLPAFKDRGHNKELTDKINSFYQDISLILAKPLYKSHLLNTFHLILYVYFSVLMGATPI